jgi:DNA-binding NtrC family response regulator
MPHPRPGLFEPSELWQQAREPTFWLDAELRIAWVNHAWEQLTGHPSQSVVGIACHAHAPTRGDDPADVAASFHPPPESLSGQPAGTTALILHSGGERIWRRIEFWPFRDGDDALIGLLGVVRGEALEHSVPDSKAGSLHAELLEVRRQLHKTVGFDSLLGSGPAHRRLLEQVRLASGATLPVLLVGEPGTGKRYVARVIHQNGPQRNGPLVSFDSEALPAEVLDRELFAGEGASHSPGPDVSPDRAPGKPRLAPAAGSTVLLREILLLPRDVQARLIASLDSSVRLIGTTALDPDLALASEQIRPEFYFALTALVVRLRPLRERREDLPILAQHMLERANQRGGVQKAGFSPQALAVLSSYDWPGNFHELARVIDHAHGALRTGQGSVDVLDLPGSIRGNLGGAYLPPSAPGPIKPLDQVLTEVEQRSIERALKHARGNKSRAADSLGISRPRLYRRIKELNLPDDGEIDDDPPPETP